MAKKQTRRCVSLSQPVYAALKAYCAKHKCSMAGLVERLVVCEMSDTAAMSAPLPQILVDASQAQAASRSKPGWAKALEERQVKAAAEAAADVEALNEELDEESAEGLPPKDARF